MADLQQELVIACEMGDGKLTELERRAQDVSASQQETFDTKVFRGFYLQCGSIMK